MSCAACSNVDLFTLCVLGLAQVVAQLAAMEVVVWQTSVYLPARLATSWLVFEAPALSSWWLLALLALSISACARLAMWVQMGAQVGSMEVFFRRGRSGGQAAGQEQLSASSEAEKGNKISPILGQNAEPKGEEAKEQRKYQCAVCGRWWELSTATRRSCSACGSPSFASWRAFSSFSPSETPFGGHPGAHCTKHGSDSAKDAGQGQAGDGLHGRGEDESALKGRKRSRLTKRMERDVVRLLGRDKVTRGGRVAWT